MDVLFWRVFYLRLKGLAQFFKKFAKNIKLRKQHNSNIIRIINNNKRQQTNNSRL